MSTVRNAGWNLASACVPIAVSLITVPPYLALIGEARYGVLAIILALLGYFGIFDFGLSAATEQRVAATPAEDIAERRKIIWTAVLVNLGLGLVAGIIAVQVTSYFLLNVAEGTGPLASEITHSLPWLILVLPLYLMDASLRGALMGAGRFADLALVNIFGLPIIQLMPLATAYYVSPSLEAVLPVVFLGRIGLTLPTCWLITSRVTRGWAPSFDRKRLHDLASFGGWVAVSSVIGQLMTALDRLVIGALVGAKAVSYYAIPFQLGQRAIILPTSLTQALFPKLASADEQARLRLSKRSLRAANAVMLPVILCGVLLVEPFLTLWISAEFAHKAALPARILLCGFWLNTLGICCFSQLYAAGKPRLVATAHCIELLPYFGMLAAGLYWFGLPGAAAAFALRVLADDFLLGWFSGLGREVLRLTLLASPLFAAAFWLTSAAGSGELPMIAAALAILVLAGSWSVVTLAQEREALATALGKRATAA